MPSRFSGWFPFSFLTRSRAFRRLTRWAFRECDTAGTGTVTRDDFYAGMLLVHVQLAKYCGAAACYPPTRAVCDEIFAACDIDSSGTIDEDEFQQCMVVCCAQISTRILVYYAVIILLVPRLVDQVVWVLSNVDDAALWLTGGGALQRLVDVASAYVDWAYVAKTIVSSLAFTLCIPLAFDVIDRRSRHAAEKVTLDQDGRLKKIK